MTEPLGLPLHALHAEYGARFGEFAGYQMPMQYPGGLRAEHLHTREQASLFDVSHMGQLRLSARDGRAATLYEQLEAALPVDFDGWASGHQRYTLLLNERGGIEDDLMLVHRIEGAHAEVRIVANAGNREADLALLRERCPKLDIAWIDAALLALQGPAAESVLGALDASAIPMRFMDAASLRIDGVECYTTRSGYTGEDGYELSIPTAQAEAIVRRLLAATPVRLAGLGARDTLRLEAGLPLHGSDIDATTTPVEAGLAFAIATSRRASGSKAGGFPGAATVLRELAEGTRRRLVGLVSREPIPIRPNAVIADENDRPVGEVTSGTVSPTLGHPVMLARIARSALDDAARSPLYAVVRNRRLAVTPSPLPFVPKRYKR